MRGGWGPGLAHARFPRDTRPRRRQRPSRHGAEMAGSFGRAGRGPTPPSSTAAPSHTPPRRGLRGVQAATGSRTSDQTCAPVCAAARGPVHAAADAALPLDCPRGLLGCQAPFRPPIGSATRSIGRRALPHLIAPQGAHKEGTGAAALCPCHWFLSPPIPLMRGFCRSLQLLKTHACAWWSWRGLASTLGAGRPQTPARPQRSVVRWVFDCRAVCCGSGRCGRLPMAGEASRVGAARGPLPWPASARCSSSALKGDAM